MKSGMWPGSRWGKGVSVVICNYNTWLFLLFLPVLPFLLTKGPLFPPIDASATWKLKEI